MSKTEVIRYFANRTNVPIKVDEVVEKIRSFSKVEKVFAFSSPLDTAKCRGFMEIWTYPDDHKYTSPPFGEFEWLCATIHYSEFDSEDWQRLVAVKEVLHILDPKYALTQTDQQQENLVKKIVLPKELQDPISAGADVNLDRIAEYQALAILFPMAARNAYLEKMRKTGATVDEMTIEISCQVSVPERYIPFMLSEDWDQTYETLCKLD